MKKIWIRICICNALLALLVLASSIAEADEPGTKATIEKALTSEYALTKTTDDKTDIVIAGAVLVLQKDKMFMVTADSAANQCPNNYKDGKLSQGGACGANEALKKIPLFGRTVPGADKVPNTRAYVTGEKFWVTKIEVRDSGRNKGIYFEFYTDAVNDIRYKGTLMIQVKGNLPSPEEALKLVGEVIKVQPSEDEAKDSKAKPGKPGGQQAPAEAPVEAPPAEPPPPAADAPPPAIEPPPPPPAEEAAPATVSIGQTPEQVVAALGQPTKKAKVGTKEIYYYKDLKVVFMNGKVKDVQ